MDHYYKNISGFFNFEKIYSEQVEMAKDNFHFVEVGSFQGQSSSFMAVEIINSGKKIKFDCIDTWTNSSKILEPGDDNSLYMSFINNMQPVEGYFNPIPMSSVEASKLYEDHSLDFVYLDGDHEYESVKADILSWISKVKIGGTIGGHDYQMKSVSQAVHNIFGIECIIKEYDAWTWLYHKK